MATQGKNGGLTALYLLLILNRLYEVAERNIVDRFLHIFSNNDLPFIYILSSRDSICPGVRGTLPVVLVLKSFGPKFPQNSVQNAKCTGFSK
jgi:hypothetical protein